MEDTSCLIPSKIEREWKETWTSASFSPQSSKQLISSQQHSSHRWLNTSLTQGKDTRETNCNFILTFRCPVSNNKDRSANQTHFVSWRQSTLLVKLMKHLPQLLVEAYSSHLDHTVYKRDPCIWWKYKRWKQYNFTQHQSTWYPTAFEDQVSDTVAVQQRQTDS